MIIVTGGAGFIGSNIVKALNQQNINDIVVVDDLTNGTKFKNLADCTIDDYFDKDDFLAHVKQGCFSDVQAIIHQGAESATTNWDGKYVMANNYEYSKVLLHHAIKHNIQFIYASSAAVYGANEVFIEDERYEKPLNVYGYSKLLFDQYVRRLTAKDKPASQIVGLRYFNVYGPREAHKNEMSSVAFHLNTQIQNQENLRLFEGTGGYENGEQRRDFIYVGDCVKVNLWFLDKPEISGIFNVGTGRSQSFNDVANAITDFYKRGDIEYISMPDKLKGRYQNFTQADITQLQNAGYPHPFKTVEEGTNAYLSWLADNA